MTILPLLEGGDRDRAACKFATSPLPVWNGSPNEGFMALGTPLRCVMVRSSVRSNVLRIRYAGLVVVHPLPPINGIVYNDVYSSVDGSTWATSNNTASWSPRRIERAPRVYRLESRVRRRRSRLR